MNYTNRALHSALISKVILQETGTYNPVHFRPYETHVDSNQALEAITNRVTQFGGSSISSSLFTGLATTFLAPSSTPGNIIPIANGWTEKRLRFLIEFTVTHSLGTVAIYYIQGFTNYPGITVSGNVDPDMLFIINSITGVTRTPMQTPSGMQMVDSIQDCNHLLCNNVFANNGNGYSDLNMTYSMRPQDVYTGMIETYATRGIQDMGDTVVLDTRAQLKSTPINSSRKHNLPGEFMSSVLSGYSQGLQLASFGGDSKNVIDEARNRTAVPLASENVFMSILNANKGFNQTNTFKYGDLVNIDPSTIVNTHYLILGNTQKAQLHNTGSTAYWNSSDRETQIATLLSQAIPALMMELMISQIIFTSTNHEATGQMNTSIINAKSLSNVELVRNFDIFKTRLEREVLYDVTFGNQDSYMLRVSSDIFGDTSIGLSFGNNPITEYNTPSFCDSLLTPIVSNDKESLYKISNDFEMLNNNIGEELRGMNKMQVNTNM